MSRLQRIAIERRESFRDRRWIVPSEYVLASAGTESGARVWRSLEKDAQSIRERRAVRVDDRDIGGQVGRQVREVLFTQEAHDWLAECHRLDRGRAVPADDELIDE